MRDSFNPFQSSPRYEGDEEGDENDNVYDPCDDDHDFDDEEEEDIYEEVCEMIEENIYDMAGDDDDDSQGEEGQHSGNRISSESSGFKLVQLCTLTFTGRRIGTPSFQILRFD